MERSEAYRRGAEMRAQLMGEDAAAAMNAGAYSDPAAQQFRDAAIELVFGGIWIRPGLDLKLRTLITVVADAATGRDEIEIHLRMALRQGWTEQEITEAYIQLMGYVGAPLIRTAFVRSRPVFEEFRAT
ncbi:MAG: hypothetical protein EXR52_04275 [Dehalococcoidia bacterium]|nr:hypothetical protein [Dehalococcoidia bacterium]